MKCSICGGDINYGERTCPYCGNRIKWETEETPAPVHETEDAPGRNVKFCTWCGAQIDPVTNRCVSCGRESVIHGMNESVQSVDRNASQHTEFCTWCGARIDPVTHRCVSCGRVSNLKHESFSDGIKEQSTPHAETRSSSPASSTVQQSEAGQDSRKQRQNVRYSKGVRPVRAAGKIVKGAASAIPSGGGKKKNKKKNNKDKRGSVKSVVLIVIGMMALFALTFVVFFNLLGGSLNEPEETVSPSATMEGKETADPEWTPYISETQKPSPTKTPAKPSKTTAPQKTKEPVRTSEPAPKPTPEPQRTEEAKQPEEENKTGSDNSEQTVVDEQKADET